MTKLTKEGYFVIYMTFHYKLQLCFPGFLLIRFVLSQAGIKSGYINHLLYSIQMKDRDFHT